MEDYYNNAHRVLKLVQKLPGLGGFSCKPITIVRNKLVAHEEPGDIYSFGFGTSGPTVRAMHKLGRAWRDTGLVANTEAFVTRLSDAFDSAVSSP